MKNLTRLKTPALNWIKIKNKILSGAHEIDLVLVGNEFMARLNAKYCRKSGPTNVLAFSLGRLAGQIFIGLSRAGLEAKNLGIAPKKYILYLYIHGLLHLKGYEHKNLRQSKIMGRAEQKWLRALS